MNPLGKVQCIYDVRWGNIVIFLLNCHKITVYSIICVSLHVKYLELFNIKNTSHTTIIICVFSVKA